jgi:DNA-binding response OmpR family regulator
MPSPPPIVEEQPAFYISTRKSVARILIIDKEVLVTGSMRLVLERAGHAVMTSSDGRTGLEIYNRERPDIVITDVSAPIHRTIETIRSLRAQTIELPIIAMSGWGPEVDLEFRRMASTLRVDIHLAKPFTNAQLLTAVMSCGAR